LVWRLASRLISQAVRKYKTIEKQIVPTTIHGQETVDKVIGVERVES